MLQDQTAHVTYNGPSSSSSDTLTRVEFERQMDYAVRDVLEWTEIEDDNKPFYDTFVTETIFPVNKWMARSYLRHSNQNDPDDSYMTTFAGPIEWFTTPLPAHLGYNPRKNTIDPIR